MYKVDWKEAKKNLAGTNTLEAFENQLNAEYSNDPQKLALALWRLLPEQIIDQNKKTEFRLKGSSAAAEAIAGKNPYLFTFSLGPVQGFIAQARRLGDLWAGSLILSHLSWVALKVVCEEVGPWAVIFPDLYNQPKTDEWLIEKGIKEVKKPDDQIYIAALPNRFTAYVPCEIVNHLGKHCDEAVREEWTNLSKQAFDIINYKMKLIVDYTIFENQINSLLDIAWGAVPVKPTNNEKYYNILAIDKTKIPLSDYALASAVSGRTYASHRQFRPFVQVSEEGDKCTLCGERMALPKGGIYKDNLNRTEFNKIWENAISNSNDKIKSYFRKGSKERLCAVCATKRLSPLKLAPNAEEARIFESTATFAAKPFVRRLREKLTDDADLITKIESFATQLYGLVESAKTSNNLPKDLGEIEEATKGNQNPEKLYVDELLIFLNPVWFYREIPFINGLDSEKVIKARNELFKKAGDLNIKSPDPHYALLLMDGDHMGRLLTYGPDIGDVTHEFHSKLSSILNDFALNIAPKTVLEHEGRLIYSGGDDVLALLPCDKVLSCAEKLRGQYSIAFSDQFGEAVSTLSGAIVFVHYSSHIRIALDTAHRLLTSEAKEKCGRNACAIQLMSSGGEISMCSFKWETGAVKWIEQTENIAQLMLEDSGISSGKIYSLMKDYELLSKLDLDWDLWLTYQVSKMRRKDLSPAEIKENVDLLSPLFEHKMTKLLRISRFLESEVGIM